MEPRFVTFRNGCERYLINVNDISTVVMSEFQPHLITISSLDGSLTEIDIADDNTTAAAHSIVDGIINAICSNKKLYEIVEIDE